MSFTAVQVTTIKDGDNSRTIIEVEGVQDVRAGDVITATRPT